MSAFIPWKVVHIELSKNIPALPTEPRYQGLYVVFWGHGIPLGHQEILADQLPMPATEVANLGLQTIVPALGDLLLEKGFKAPMPELPKHLVEKTPPDFQELMALERPFAKLERYFSQPSEVSVSVVICTRERPAQLIQCLKSLQNLSQLPQEIVVVDNAPTSEATREAVAQIPNVKYVREPRPGLSGARNTGILHSTGDIMAFTDDDVMLHPEWLTRLLRGFENSNVMSITGYAIWFVYETLKGLKSFNRLLVSGLFGAFVGVNFYFHNRQLSR